MFKTEPLYSSTPASGSSNKNLNNLLADDDEPQGEPPGLIQQILNFFSKLWSPSTSDAEKLGYSYVYAEDGSLLGEYGSGGSNSTGTAQYIYLPTASGPMPIAAVIKGQTYAVHSDHLNTPRKLTQPDGQVAWQWAYSAFGDEQPTIGAKRFTSESTTPTTGATSIPEVTFNLRYPGQYFDPETKLHYNYFRTYAPSTGRYTQGDPIGLDGGWNRFGYVASDPLGFADDEGLQRRAGGPATLSWGQAQLNFQGVSLTNQIRQYQPNYSYSYASAPGQGFTAANIGQLQSTLQRLQSVPSCVASSSTAFSSISTQVSQKQLRHIHERNEYRGGGYLNNLQDAQAVLDALHFGNAVLLGYSRQGFPIVRVDSVVGANVNLGAGIVSQPTNVFMIKGTAHPSVVPMNPNWNLQ